MGTIRLIVDGPGYTAPTEVGVDQLSELLTNPKNRLWLDIIDHRVRVLLNRGR